VVAGALLGSSISKKFLEGCVVTFEVGVALMFLTQALRSHREAGNAARILSKPGMLIFSTTFGVTSSVVGIAGGTLFVPFLNFCGVGLRRAIGTATALGAPLSIVAALVYMLTGMMGHRSLPPHSLGFIYYPAFLGCAVGGIWTTRHGARLGLKMNLRMMKLIFALILLGAAGKMLYV
jgi:uncharacterized membrane protein YfcA